MLVKLITKNKQLFSVGYLKKIEQLFAEKKYD